MSTTKRPLGLFLVAGLLCCSLWSHWAGCSSLLKLKLDKLASVGGPTSTTYLVHVDVGTPRRALKLLVDVNAREVWLKQASLGNATTAWLGESLTSVSDRDGQPDDEAAAAEPAYVVEYEQFRLTGRIRADYFQFSNVAASPARPMFKQRYLAVCSMEAATAAPEAATHEDNFRSQVDGVLALNTYPVSDLGSDLVTVGLSRAKLTRELKFSLLFNAGERGLDELAFGGEQPDKFVGDSLRYHKVEAQFKWQVSLGGVLLGAQPISSCSEPGDHDCKATISTVTDCIRGPADEVRALLAYFEAQGPEQEANRATHFQTIDCARQRDAPKLTFVIDDVMYAIPPASYIRTRGAQGNTTGAGGPTECYLALAASVASPATRHWQLGTNFLENYYTVFDVNKRQIAFGRRVAT